MRTSKKKTIPALSVISANYNNGEFLDEFFFWLEKSSVLPCEVIIVDDGSQDNSVRKLQSYNGTLNLKCFLFEDNKGFSAALNYAVEKSTGEYLLRIDTDDLIHPDRIEKQLDFIQKNKEVDLVGSNARYFQSNPLKPIFKTNLPVGPQNIISSIENGDIPLLHSCIIGKKEVFEKNPYKESKFPMEDYLFYCDLVKSNVCMANMPEMLTFVRIHPKSASSNLSLGRTREIFMIREKRFSRKFSVLEIYLNYFHTKLYRKFLLSESVCKWFWLILAGALKPYKIINRIIQR